MARNTDIYPWTHSHSKSKNLKQPEDQVNLISRLKNNMIETLIITERN